MHFGKIQKCDVANGPGVRVTLFVSGCDFHCPGCFNECAWDYGYGTPFTEDTIREVLALADKPYIRGLTLLGGEPLAPKNRNDVFQLLSSFRKKFGEGKDVWIYSGYTFEKVVQDNCYHGIVPPKEILALCDTMVDGQFHLAEKDLSLVFRGSRNQRVLDLRQTLSAGQPILMAGY